ncbi:unnamed protein product [Camellia sinensis]
MLFSLKIDSDRSVLAKQIGDSLEPFQSSLSKSKSNSNFISAIQIGTMVATVGLFVLFVLGTSWACDARELTTTELSSTETAISDVSVHDQQLVDDIPVEKLLIYDVPVDIICTPTQVIFTNTPIPKPQVSNTIYLDSPDSVGFSYSENMTFYSTGDLQTAFETNIFLLKVIGSPP